ncbi:MAG TPA: alpha/beta fold hydrolase, partial [Bacteroidia bacterium]|nr:alpha/beta fold hydrolase [Bacteroidia bacterium]
AALLDERMPEDPDHETVATEESSETEATTKAEAETVETTESHETPASPSVVVPTAKLADTTVALQPRGDLPPLFAVHGGDGGILFYGQLAERLGEARPFYAFEAPALTANSPIPDESVEQTAAHYLAEMLKVQPDGPYCLCGYSFGGVVAYEMARQLVRLGKSVDFLGLVDTENPGIEARKLSLGERIAVNWKKPNPDGKGVFGKVGQLSRRVSSGLAYRLYFEAEDAVARTLPHAKGAGWLRQVQLRKAHEKAMDAYVPGPYPGRLTLFRAMVGGDKFEIGDDYGWSDLVGELDIVDVPGNHVTIFHKEHIDSVAEAFREALRGVAVG